MAQISVSISTYDGSRFAAALNPTQDMISIDLHTNIYSGYDERPGIRAHQAYERTVVNIHGTLADLQLLADRIVAAVYPDKCQADPDADTRSETDFQHQEAVDAR